MKETRYGMGVEVALPYEQAVDRTIEELKKEGFGVLTTIDVKQTLKQKLDKDFRKYTILGACNPPLAYRAFQAELAFGRLGDGAAHGDGHGGRGSGSQGRGPRSR